MFEFLKCYKYSEVEKIAEEWGLEIRELGNSDEVGLTFYVLEDDFGASKASFSLSGVSGEEYILRCVVLDNSISTDGQYHS